MRIKNFTAIMKVSERCNIDCDYCYYYNIGDDSWKGYPAYMSDDAMEVVARRLAELTEVAHIETLFICFHGGEPMMAKIASLEQFMAKVKSRVNRRTSVEFAIQTNGTINRKEWFQFFERSGIQVGISIDGPADYHDVHRRTKKNKPTHSLVSTFIKECTRGADSGKMRRPGTITVIDNKFDAKRVIEHLRSEFNLSRMSFIMPDDVANDILFNEQKASEYARVLIDLYEERVKDRRIRSKEVMKFLGKISAPKEQEQEGLDSTAYVGVTIQSNALMKINEELISTGTWRKSFPVVDLKVGDIASYVKLPEFTNYLAAATGIPSKCGDCEWKNVCRGGSMQERRNPANGFNDRSVLCSSYKQLYQHMYDDLVSHGFPEELLKEKLAAA
jgi:uncharacterized protein